MSECACNVLLIGNRVVRTNPVPGCLANHQHLDEDGRGDE